MSGIRRWTDAILRLFKIHISPSKVESNSSVSDLSGSTSSQTNLSRVVSLPVAPTPPSSVSGVSEVDWLIEKARAGDADSQFALGKAFLLGRGLRLDMSAAERWLARSAAKGNKAAARLHHDVFAEARHLPPLPISTLGPILPRPVGSASKQLEPTGNSRRNLRHRSFKNAFSLNAQEKKVFVQRGRTLGKLCRREAERALDGRGSHRLPNEELTGAKQLAFQLARSKGWLSSGTLDGMHDLSDASDPQVEEQREAFLSGIMDALGPEEC